MGREMWKARWTHASDDGAGVELEGAAEEVMVDEGC